MGEGAWEVQVSSHGMKRSKAQEREHSPLYCDSAAQ